MKLKSNKVNPKDLTPQTLLAMIIADPIYKKYGREFVATSLNDSVHRDGSKHYTGNGVDGRTYYFTEDQKKQVVAELKTQLGLYYDIILESDHIHIEYDPK